MADAVKWVSSGLIGASGAATVAQQPPAISNYIEGGVLGILALVLYYLLTNFSHNQREITKALRDVEKQIAIMLDRDE
jgi:hypothetical protein